LARLASHGAPAELPVIIERSSGLVVDRLLEAGYPVVPVHPTAFHTARPRWGASGAKSDPGDSYKVADYLRTDGHRLRRLVPVDSGLRELQALVRLCDDHVRARTAAGNQLGALLEQHWPGPRNLFCSLVSDIALNFLTDYPTPASGRPTRRSPHGRLLQAPCLPRRQTSIRPAGPAPLRSRRPSQPPHARPHHAHHGTSPAPAQSAGHHHPARDDHQEASRQAPSRRPPRPVAWRGHHHLAQLLAEVGPILDRVESAEQAAAECGAAPVTKASGKAHGVYFRLAANTRARKAVTAFAHNSRM
jgi:hypothetical protein